MESQIIGQMYQQYLQLMHANMQAGMVEQQQDPTQLPGTTPPTGAPPGWHQMPDGSMMQDAEMSGQDYGMPPEQGMMGAEPGMMAQQEEQPTDENGVPIGQPYGQPKQIAGLPGIIAQQFRQVTPEQLQAADDGLLWDITIDVESLSPVTEEQYGNRLIQALNMLSSPGVGQLLAMSPPLARTLLNLMGIRNSNDQQNIFTALQQKMMMDQQMAMMGGPGPVGVAPQGGTASPQPGAGTAGGPQPNQKAKAQ